MTGVTTGFLPLPKEEMRPFVLAFLWGFLTPQGEGTISCGLNVW